MAQTTPLGVYFLANDHVLPWVRSFVRSFRQHNPDLPLCLIPFNDHSAGTRRIVQEAGGTVLELPETFERLEQIGAALASLRGGGGLDPINKLRTAIGLDRLRIVGADAAAGRGTAVAVGKNLGRRFYTEIVTDGRGYNATQLEYRVTRWLSLLASVSSLGRQGVDAKVSKDY